GQDSHAQLAALLDSDLVPRTMINGIEYAALVQPLHAPAAAFSTASPVPVAIVLRSRTERMRTLSAIQTGLGIATFATLLLAVAVSYGVARTVTRPLARITDHMRHVAATGDLTRKLQLSDSRRWHDEDARLLAATFNTLTDSIARFQREMSQKEPLSSAGRRAAVHAQHMQR